MMLFVFMLMFLMGFTPMGNAQNISVTSGEHESFSRLVLTFSQPLDWALAREASGYSLTTGQRISNYDLSDAFRRLTKKRVTDIRKESMTGALYIAVNCECYAMPFELRPGILVIDIRDGTAPSGSSFELATDGTLSSPLLGADIVSDKINTSSGGINKIKSQSDLTTLASAIESAARTPPTHSPRISETALENTRDELLWQISKGAADGVVDVNIKLESASAKPQDMSQNKNINAGPEPGIKARTSERMSNLLTGNGKKCFSNEDVDIGNWGGEGDKGLNFSANTTGLVTEFDKPNMASIEHAVKYLLALGFGAESRALLKSFKVESERKIIWEALSYLVDEEESPVAVFQDMEVCNTNAALWAFLSNPEKPLSNEIDTSSILRAFSTLPLHMRRFLGTEIATRFLNRNDFNAAHAIKASVLRSPIKSDTSAQMLDAKIKLSDGEIESAELILGPLLGTLGPVGIHSTVALIEAKVNAGYMVPEHLTVTTEAMLHEAIGGENEAALRNALALAYASQNNYQRAFTLISKKQEESVLLWSVLAHQGDDNSLLSEAIVNDLKSIPKLSPVIENEISDRLLKLGFPKEAAAWIKRKIHPLQSYDDSAILTLEAQSAQNYRISNLKNDYMYMDGNFKNSAENVDAAIRKNGTVNQLNINIISERDGDANPEVRLKSAMKPQEKYLQQDFVNFKKNENLQIININQMENNVISSRGFVETLTNTRSLVNQSSVILKDLTKLLLN